MFKSLLRFAVCGCGVLTQLGRDIPYWLVNWPTAFSRIVSSLSELEILGGPWKPPKVNGRSLAPEWVAPGDTSL